MSQTITASLIKELRERTGVGMGKCKEALEASQGDIELAIANLRKAGIASAVKKEGRETKEGKIAAREKNGVIALVEVNAETDFVVNNAKFSEFVDNLVEEALKTKPASLSDFLSQKFSKDPELTIDQYRATLVQSIGENIQIKRVEAFSKRNDTSVGIYSHLGGKIVTFVEIQGSASEEALAKDIAMHVAAAAPEYLSPEEVSADIIEKEREIARVQIKGKPENIIEKIIDGKVNAYMDMHCLIKQKFIKNDALSIQDLMQARAKESGKPLALTRFLRWSVGQ